jgi:hypothetical protein
MLAPESMTAWATFALVLITAYYAWQSWRVVREMRAARMAQYAPVLVARIVLHSFFDHRGRYVLQNVGPGPALAVDVQLRLEPGDVYWRVRSTALAPGESRPICSEGRIVEFDTREHGEQWSTIWLSGACLDIAGTLHRVDLRIPLRELSELAVVGPGEQSENA